MLVIKNGTLISMAGIYKEKYDVAVENGKKAQQVLPVHQCGGRRICPQVPGDPRRQKDTEKRTWP